MRVSWQKSIVRNTNGGLTDSTNPHKTRRPGTCFNQPRIYADSTDFKNSQTCFLSGWVPCCMTPPWFTFDNLTKQKVNLNRLIFSRQNSKASVPKNISIKKAKLIEGQTKIVQVLIGCLNISEHSAGCQTPGYSE